jgi:hypothetical protein
MFQVKETRDLAAIAGFGVAQLQSRLPTISRMEYPIVSPFSTLIPIIMEEPGPGRAVVVGKEHLPISTVPVVPPLRVVSLRNR